MTALFVPALRIMGERFPDCAELPQHHSSAGPGKQGARPEAAAAPAPQTGVQPPANAAPAHPTKIAVTKLQLSGF